MDVALFHYDLPPERIAQEAVEPRDAARLLVLDRAGGPLRHMFVRDLPDLLRAGDLVVVNDTRVVPARLLGRKATGGRVEILLLERCAAHAPHDETWRVLIGAAHAPKHGSAFGLPAGFTATIVAGPREGGEAEVRLVGPAPIATLLEEHGRLPLPPYIRRTPDDPRSAVDRARYQTLFAARDGALAAPTAGLHFTPALMERLAARGVGTTSVTLHVGEGTFAPVRVATTAEISLHAEHFEIPEASSRAIAEARARECRVVAVGTTVTRALESRPMRPDRAPEPGTGATSLFIAPGFHFRYVDALLTNFHLPSSTLLMLVSAFAGRERVLDAYRTAVTEGYRFYSYGDAMLIL